MVKTKNNTNGKIKEFQQLVAVSSNVAPFARELAVRGNTIDFNFFAGFLPNPDIVLKFLNREQDIYEDILDDAHLQAVISQRKSGVKSLFWEVDRGKSKSRQAKFIQKAFERLDIYRLMSEILDSVLYGWQPIEIVWEREKDSKLLFPNRVQSKPQRWFHFDSQNLLRFKTFSNSSEGIIVPPNKFLIPRHDGTYDNPYGVALLSNVYWPVTFKKGSEKWWIKFLEKYGTPFAVGKLPHGAPEAEYKKLNDFLVQLVQDGTAAIPDDSKIELLEPAGKKASSDIYLALIKWANSEISKAIVGQTLTTEQDKTGSYALGQVHYTVRQDLIEEDKRLVEKTMNELIDIIFKINFGSGEVPKFVLFKDEDVDKALADRDKTLSEIGVTFTKDYIRKAYGFEDGDIEIGPSPTSGGFKQFAQLTRPPFVDQRAIDNMVGSIKPEQFQEISKFVKPFIDVVNDSNDFEDAQEKMVRIFPEVKTDELEKMITRSIFLSEVMGRLAKG